MQDDVGLWQIPHIHQGAAENPAAQQSPEDYDLEQTPEEGGSGGVPLSLDVNTLEGSGMHTHIEQEQQHQQQPANPDDVSIYYEESRPSHPLDPSLEGGNDEEVAEEREGSHEAAAQPGEVSGVSVCVDADLDALDVPMVWLEPQIASFAVEDEDYD